MLKQNKLFLDVLFICFSIPEISRGQKDKFIDSITISTLRFEKLATALCKCYMLSHGLLNRWTDNFILTQPY